MKIGMQTWGTEGDIRPFIALAGELQGAGHEVTLAAASVHKADFNSLEKSLGFRLVDHAMPAYEPDFMARLGKSIIGDRNPLRQLRTVLSYFLEPVVEDLLATAKKLCRENEILIRHAMVYPAAIAAEKANLPCVCVFPTLAPVPSTHISPLNVNLGRYANSLMWKLADRILNRYFRPAIDGMRKRERLMPVKSVLQDSWFSDYLTLIAVSPALFPPRPDWKDDFHVSGFCNVPERNEPVPMPDGLDKFLDSGPRPVFMTFGSIMKGDPAPGDITRLMIDAARIAGCRAVIQSRWDLIRDIPESTNIYRVAEVAHQEVFPRCAAVVHAGGAGTTQTVIRAGCPSVIVAHANDQSSWGMLLKQAGMAPKPLYRRTVTAEKLARSILSVLDDPEMSTRVRRISRKMSREDGRRRAVELIEERFKKASGPFRN